VILPYRSDAPIYHGPWGTLGLIAANVLVYVLVAFTGTISDQAYLDWWILNYDDFNPVTLLTSAFAHAGFWHLFGNMIFLWAFGLIIEGKLGWKRYLPLYLGLCIVPNIIEALIMVPFSGGGGSLGASTAISGLVAMALLWAPRNEMDVIIWFIFVIHVELAVYTVAGFFIVWDLLGALLLGFAMSTSVLHLLGVVVGLPLGVLFLKKGWVDCEGWDLLTIRKHGRPQPQRVQTTRLAREVAEQRIERREAREQAEALIDSYLDDREIGMADQVFHNACQEQGHWDLPAATLKRLIQQLGDHEEPSELDGYLDAAAGDPDLVNDCHILRVRQCLDHGDAAGAIAILRGLQGARLDDEQRARC